MDGLNLKFTGDILNDYFTRDKYGSYIPDRGKLQMDVVTERVRKQLNARTGLYRRLAEIYNRTDVQFTDNPLGNTPVLGVGFKLFGKRPLNRKGGNAEPKGRGQNLTKQLEKRERKIESVQKELMALHKGLEPTLKSDQEKLLWLVEGDQVMTGGGFDNNKVGDIHKSGLDFVINSSASIDYEDSVLSEVVVQSCAEVRAALVTQGLREGSLQPQGASVVRANQDTDGMFGWPVYAKGNDALTKDLATRLLIESGVDTRSHVGEKVTDSTTKVTYDYRVIDAGGFILDNKVFSANDMVSLVTLLARIQKHGWKVENGELVPKDGKARSVYPNAFLPSLIEAMVMAPFNDKLKELKVSFMPSLQDKPTRVSMIKTMIKDALQRGYDYLAADWSKYDATVKGAILATVIQLVVKPFFHADYYAWVDAATFILTYKYLIMDKDLCGISPEPFAEAKSVAPYTEVKNYIIFGLIDGLISGAKFTHTGGSLYGEVVLHHGIARLLEWTPIIGPQAGDDTLMGVPLSRIDVSSVEKTYGPIIDAASRFGVKANLSKQIWHQMDKEIVKVFLQDSYHAATDTWGVGSIFRPASAIWTSERNKGLSVAEQLMAEIARMNAGADSPFVHIVVAWWLSHERYLGWLFKTYGVSGFQKLIETIGKPLDEIAQSIDVGSFSFGISRSDLEAGTLPILSVMADVASQMSFSSEDRASFLGDLTPESDGIEDDEQLESEGLIQP
jgi:hypothetical protein